MSRDGQLPRFLAHLNSRSKVPERAILLVAGITLVLGLLFVGQIGLISSLVNFGALTSFLLHLSVMTYYGVRRKSSNIVLHWVGPIIGFLIIGFVLWNAEPAVKIGGLVWLAIGILVLVYYSRKGTGILPEHRAEELTMAESHLITKDHAHADYSAAHEPVLTVDPGTGERITFETDDAAYAQMEELRDLAKVTATINPVTGPVHVRELSPVTPSR